MPLLPERKKLNKEWSISNQNLKKNLERGMPRLLPGGRGTLPPDTSPPRRLQRLVPCAFGARILHKILNTPLAVNITLHPVLSPGAGLTSHWVYVEFVAIYRTRAAPGE